MILLTLVAQAKLQWGSILLCLAPSSAGQIVHFSRWIVLLIFVCLGHEAFGFVVASARTHLAFVPRSVCDH